MAVASVPLDGRPALNLIPVTEFSMEASGPRIDLTVLLEMYAEMSEGMESNPHEGMMMEPVLVA